MTVKAIIYSLTQLFISSNTKMDIRYIKWEMKCYQDYVVLVICFKADSSISRMVMRILVRGNTLHNSRAFHFKPREFLYLFFREYCEDWFVFMAKSKQKSKEKKSRLSEDKKLTVKTNSGENQPLSRRQSVTEESTKLSQNVQSINKKMEHDGEVMFFERLPQKIIELTEYLKVVFSI